MICLGTFDNRNDLLSVLESAGLARDNRHDQSCVDVFQVWQRVYGPVVDPYGFTIDAWHDDTSKPAKWTANVARDLTPIESEALAAYVVSPPSAPRRVFA